MITTEQSWMSRVLEQDPVADTWKIDAYEQYRTRLRDPHYPCFFGQTAEARAEMLYSFTSWSNLRELASSMRKFVGLIRLPPHERSSLTAFFEPDRAMASHQSFVERFWSVLQFLHEQDRSPAMDKTPDHPLWEFAFEGCEMFVVGASPTYQRRRSRNLGPGMVLVFQPRHLFIDPATSEPIAATVRQRIHGRMLAYDEMSVHPDIGFYGQPSNREWKQYALPDDNEPERGSCPFHTRSSR